MQADYVIVGAGSAGCVLANRLTEDPAVRVILIEAGGRDWNPLIHIPVGFMKLLDHPTLTWNFKAEADPGTAGRADPLPARPGAGRLVVDQRPDLHPRPARGFRPLGAARQSRLELGRRAALFQAGRELAGRRQRAARQGRLSDNLADDRAPGGVPGDHRRRRRARGRVQARCQQPAARHRRQHRLVPADPWRAAPRQRRADLPEAGVKAAQPRSHHERAGAPRLVQRQARDRGRAVARRQGRDRRCGARGDPRRRCDWLATPAAIVGCRRAG